MLTNCPECEGEVSSEGVLCPHCGFPFAEIEESGHALAKVAERRVKVWHVAASLVGGVAIVVVTFLFLLAA